MTTGMIGRKVGMMTLYDGGGIKRGVTVVELGPNPVTQLRSADRDGYQAVQIGFAGRRKRLTRPERGHLQAAGVADRPLSELQEFRVDDIEGYELGQILTVEQFEPGSYVDVTATSKGRGFAGVVRRWNFKGGPKTHGQSDRHRAPGSIGAGTTPGRVWKGQKMGGHMGNVTSTVRNLLVVAIDPSRNLIFVEGSVPGARNGIVTVKPGLRSALAAFEPAAIAAAEMPIVEEPEDEPVVEEPAEDAPVEETATDETANDTAGTDDGVETDDEVATDNEAETDNDAETDDEVATDNEAETDDEAETDEAETDENDADDETETASNEERDE